MLTSNVDGHFERNSFDPSKIYTAQGDMQYIQCLKPCSKQVLVAHIRYYGGCASPRPNTCERSGVAHSPSPRKDAAAREQGDAAAHELGRHTKVPKV